MFRKQAKIKSNSQLKASDRKKLKQELRNQYEHITEDELDLLFPSSVPLSCIKVITNTSKNLLVYSVNRVPMVFELEKALYPTVYMLWKVPHLLVALTTHDLVMERLANGANLMLPGVILSEGTDYSGMKAGDRVAVNSVSNPNAFAVGTLATDLGNLNELEEKKGKCVEILHMYGDKLWSLEAKSNIPSELSPIRPSEPEIVQTPETSSPVDEVAEAGETTALPESNEAPQDGKIENDHDDLILHVFLKALLTSMKHVSLPILANVFYKNHMLEASPSGQNLDLKRTKYKKLSVFLAEMEKLGVISLDSFTKGVLSLTSINLEHELLRSFHKNHREELVMKPVEAPCNQDSPSIHERYTISASVLPVFEAVSPNTYRKGDPVNAEDIRKTVTKYVKSEKIQDPQDKQFIHLDQTLAGIIGIRGKITWDVLMSKFFCQMGQCYQVNLPGNQMIQAKGKVPPIELVVSTRTGCKKVTLINNLEVYGISLNEFCRECQHGVAASATINHNKPGTKFSQVQVQGHQIAFIGKLLTEHYKIPKRYIRGLEEASKKK